MVLLTRRITDWHTIGRSAIYGTDKPICIPNNNKMKQKKKNMLESSFSFSFVVFTGTHQLQQNETNLTNHMQNGLPFYGLNENVLHRCGSIRNFICMQIFRRILLPIWWEPKCTEHFLIFLLHLWSSLFQTNRIGIGTPAIWPAKKKCAPKKNKYN